MIMVLLQVAERYDVLLIQEIRDVSGTAINSFLEQLNGRPGNNYSMVISPRLGRTTSKEQYAFLYRNGAGLSITETYTYDDGEESNGTDTFEREPYVVKLRSQNTVVRDLVLIACHTSPSQARYEIAALENVYDDGVRRWGIKDVLILGDLNADCDYVPRSAWNNIGLRTDRKFSWLIGDKNDTTVTSTHCAYDRFVASGSSLLSAVVDGSVQVYDFQSQYGLTQSQAEAVSDHFPIELELAKRRMQPTGIVTDKNGGGGQAGRKADFIIRALGSLIITSWLLTY
ncbi:DNASE1L3 [Branchiostoma lanceolatum]|uniref:Deoxyribonuclease n=1 Tax=Branchiostoma lanceolatum TaxID=7740 RepID=A0A8K0A746_BRALA|nr:DNASE1L3 [Branchiostoma lanceolatum]